MAERPLIEMRSFGYRYPGGERAALSDLSLTVAEGELLVLAGRSGSGKSTLLRACCGLVPHYHGGEARGSLAVAGLDAREHGPAELGGLVGFVGQDPEAELVAATVRGELELPLELRGDPPAARARALEEVALALGIAHLVERATETLSGGERQRVALAAALVLRPRLVLLDEPASQLDPVAGEELIALLRRLNEEWGMAVMLAEHRLERCLASADRVLAIADGRLAFDGRPQGFADWAQVADPSLMTPGMRLFSLAGLRPLPLAAKQARLSLRAQGIEPGTPPPAADARSQAAAGSGRRPARARAGSRVLAARDLWVELDSGGGSRDVLRGIGFALAPGERVALMGRNGAGKSTLLRAAADLVQPARGRIEAPRGLALLPQSPGDLFVRERVREELPGAAGERALASVGLEWAAGRDPRDLSGGERERLALAIAIAGRDDGQLPGAICLDEPTRGMDGARKQELARWLAELAAAGAAVLVATHEIEFAAGFAERVLLLGDGELIADAPADEVLSGGWYFATEVARILGGEGPITPEAGARSLRAATAAPAGDRAPALAPSSAVPGTVSG